MLIQEISISDINPAPYNPRKDLKKGDREYEKLKKSIVEFDLVEPLVWNKRSKNLIGGHQRFKIIKDELKLETVQVVVVDYTDKKEKALNVALNKISGEWDFPKLKELLVELDDGSFDLSLTGFDELELKDLIDYEGKAGLTEDDEIPDTPTDPVTQRGDLYILGEHRLLCGDSTKKDDVEKVLDGNIPFIMVTDPPYGVEYDPHWRDGVVGEFGKKNARGDAATNDHIVDWTETYKLFPGSVAYVWHAARFTADVCVNLRSADLEIRSSIIWKKQHFALSRGHYHWQHEPCWYAVRKGQSGKWCGDRTQSTFWEISSLNPAGRKEERIDGHGTQKPLECMARPIRNHGGKEDAVYDPFLGSGTTLIAAEKAERRCFGLEIEPKYCDVIVKRWEKFTGQKAERHSVLNREEIANAR